METAYWIVAGFLAVFYLYAGTLKMLRSKEQLAPMMGWVDTIPMGTVRFIGAVEVLGAIGLIVPALTGIGTWLTIVAAGGLAALQVLAFVVHVSRGEGKESTMNVVLVALAVLAAFLATSVV